jgi:hypothetical protein
MSGNIKQYFLTSPQSPSIYKVSYYPNRSEPPLCFQRKSNKVFWYTIMVGNSSTKDSRQAVLYHGSKRADSDSQPNEGHRVIGSLKSKEPSVLSPHPAWIQVLGFLATPWSFVCASLGQHFVWDLPSLWQPLWLFHKPTRLGQITYGSCFLLAKSHRMPPGIFWVRGSACWYSALEDKLQLTPCFRAVLQERQRNDTSASWTVLRAQLGLMWPHSNVCYI